VVTAVLALSVLGQSATVQASQTSSTVLTSLESGRFVGVDAAHAHTIVWGASAVAKGTDVLQTRTYAVAGSGSGAGRRGRRARTGAAAAAGPKTSGTASASARNT